MARHFRSKINYFFRNINNIPVDHPTEYTGLVYSIRFGIFSTIGVGHFMYTWLSSRDEKIEIKKKYIFTENGFSNFMIVDKNDKHYNVNNSIWYQKWDSIEDWTYLKEEQNIKARVYGYRFPILGIFPNIVRSLSPEKPDDSASKKPGSKLILDIAPYLPIMIDCDEKKRNGDYDRLEAYEREKQEFLEFMRNNY